MIFNYQLATHKQKSELIDFCNSLNTFAQEGKNLEFAGTLSEIAKYQLAIENSNIWCSALSVCCEAKFGSFHRELNKAVKVFEAALVLPKKKP